MNKELIDKIITYNYNEFGNEFGDCIVDMKKEIERLTNDLEREKSQVKEYGTRLIKAIEYIEENKTTHECNEWCFDNMLEDIIPLLDILKGSE